MSEPDARDTMVALLETIDLDAGSDGLEPTRTRRPRVDSAGHARELLSELRASETGRGEFRPDVLLGVGGMGEVRAATQTSLGRTVAVKRVRPSLQGPDTAVRLLQEAWITGALEHPNIVPVHELGVDAKGEPFMVLKRVKGDRWLDLIHEPELLSERHGVHDPLEWHLQVLLEICHAVSFAHHRGVLHRDLKPENIMVGAFGEVLVMDWGLAVGLPHADPRLPRADAESSLVGTPAYMAPEMLPHGHGFELCAATDVFLLGACLFEALTGRPPRTSRDRETLVRQILAGGPEIPPDVPAELGRICARAMARDPADRFPSIERFAQALRDTLRHRSSTHLAAEADRQADALILSLREGNTEPRTVHAAFGAVQFGYTQALQSWPDNPSARIGLRRVVREVVQWALDRDEVSTAEAALAATEPFDPALLARVEDARRAADAQADRLAAWRRDHDPSVGRTGRLIAILTSGLLVSVAPLFFGWIEQVSFGGPHLALSWIAALAFLGVVVPLVVAIRATEGAFTAITRPATRGLMVVAGTQVILAAGCTALGVDARTTTIVFFVLWIAIASMLGALVDRRMWVGAAGYTVAFLAVSNAPDQVFVGMAAANVVQTLAGLWALGGRRARVV